MPESKRSPHSRTAALVNGLALFAFLIGVIVRHGFGHAVSSELAEAAGVVSYCTFVVFCLWSWLILSRAGEDDFWCRLVASFTAPELMLAVVGVPILLW